MSLVMNVEDNLSRLTKVVRTKRPVLWVGAGLSQCVGLPGAADLVDALIAKCDNAHERERLQAYGCSLPEVAQEFQEMRSREELVQIVASALDREPEDTAVYSYINDIPQIDC